MPTSPPRREGPAAIRRLFRTRKSLSGFTQWFIGAGICLLALFAAAFWLAYLDRGFREAYQILLSMDPPWNKVEGNISASRWHPLSWFASVVGWAAIPAITGGAAGYIISKRIDGYTHTFALEIFQRRRTKVRDKLRLPPAIPWIKRWPVQLDDAPDATIAAQWLATRTAFVDFLVQVAHGGDWRKAQKHWEIVVANYLNSPEFSGMGRRRKLASSTGAALMLLELVIINSGTCFVCDVHDDPTFI
ncbi:DUF6313 family protein [Actinomadura bangladeshensis]|uniref:Uncharacterized protein n=1 Tax=Actinomadura bangladeshensis TaxID=453573 RepID=A0A6L9QZA5_9ACTN|nr:DUF6313 family protein [Actinomadura bangladeshensis]NEA29913.1 hypothetical protein [Actinomadura bangladeshensis]